MLDKLKYMLLVKYFKEISSKINSDFKNMEMTTPTPLKNPGDLKRQK